MADIEGPIQRAICSYLTTVLDPAVAQWFAIPNENDGTPKMNSRLNAQGRKKGVADLQIVHAGRALFIEVKSPKGTQSPSQKEFEQRICIVGASYGVARSVDDAAMLMERWGVPTRVRRLPHRGSVT